LILLVSLVLQVDPRLASKSWPPEDHWADTLDKPLFIFEGDDGSVFHWDSSGRIKVPRDERDPDVWAGYRLLTISVDSDLESLDREFTDLALAGAWAVGDFSFAAGVGTVNDGLFSDPDTLYGLGFAEYRKGALRGGVSYDGNRSYLPGYPLPYVSWIPEFGNGLRLSLGTLESTASGFTASARWAWPTDGSIRMEQVLGRGFRAYGELLRRIDGFHERGHEETRLFYQFHTAEAGLRWAGSWLDLSLGGGCAFKQRWTEGTDLGNDRTVATPEDRPYVALTIQGTF
jgi:hypothetical protein